jgi:DNA-binding response OmpR family regulator
MRVLVIEDDSSIAGGIIDVLGASSIDALHVETGAEGLAAVDSYRPDIILLDLGLPDMDGTDVCRRVRASSSVPIIVVSARDEEIDRVVALEMGADDYLVKPFGMRELVARIRAVARRTSSIESDHDKPVSVFGGLSIDSRSRRVSLEGEEVFLTPKEFDLLAYLASDAGAVFRRNDILSNVWDTNWYGTTKTLDAHVAAIRKKLGNAGWIVSVRSVGFRFDVPQ